MIPPMVIRPSVKLIRIAYVIAGLLAIEAAIIGASEPTIIGMPWWVLLLIPLWIAGQAGVRHIARLGCKLTISGERIRLETGILSKSTRVMELAKIQDVRVDQTLAQRVIKVGRISLETAGETSRIEMPAIDQPQKIADHILEMARAQRDAGPKAT